MNIAKTVSPAQRSWYASLTLDFSASEMQPASGQKLPDSGEPLPSFRTALSGVKRVGPLSVQKAFYPEGPQCAHVYLLHPPAGIVSGDDLNISINLAQHANALITTPGANRFYRARTDLALGDSQQKQQVTCTLEPNSLLENLPQETIIFDAADAINQIDIHMSESSVYAGWEMISLGLPAANEGFGKGRLTQRCRVFCEQQLVYHDRINIHAKSRILKQLAGLGDNPIFGTFIVYAPKLLSPVSGDQLVADIRQLLETEEQDKAFSCTNIEGLIVTRYLGARSDICKQVFTRIWQLARPYYCQRQASEPRIWFT